MLDIDKVRSDFPILSRKLYGKNLIYLDNAATTHKPLCVINKEKEIYEMYNSNIHRGVHTLSRECSEMYEAARETVRSFINAKSTNEIIFTAGTTASINLVANSFGDRYVRQGDEIIVSEMEHHSNIVPWQLMCERRGAKVKMLPFDENGDLKLDVLDHMLTPKTKLVCIAQASNVLGTINPIDDIIIKAHKKGIPVLVDGAQGIQHCKTDVVKSDIDFYVFSGHKLYAPTGIGVLYAKEEYLNEMPPWQGGGEMIKTVSFTNTQFADLPFKFEAGTPNFVGVIAMAEAIHYLTNLGLDTVYAYEAELSKYFLNLFNQTKGLTMYGNSANKTGIASFSISGVHHSDVGEVLDKLGIAIRTGRLCTDPIMQHYKLTGLSRASWTFYNTKNEIEAFFLAILRIKAMFS